MYTQCPHCETAFRVTAPDLQRASGRVLCAGCSREFNALERLTEDPPAAPGAASAGKSLLEALNDLTGPHEIRIEDTGVEWRVIDEDEAEGDFEEHTPAREAGAASAGDDPSGDAGEHIEPQPSPAAEPDSGSTASVHWHLEESASLTAQEPLELLSTYDGLDVQRYDDNTPLPEDFEEPEPETPRRRAEDRIEPRSAEADEAQVDLALGEADDWVDLLDEVGQRTESASAADDRRTETPAPRPGASGEDTLSATDVRSPEDDEAVDDSFPSDIDTQFDLQAIEMGIELTGSRNLAAEDTHESVEGERPTAAAPDPSDANEGDADDRLEMLDEADPAADGDGEDAEERLREQAFEQELAAAWSMTPDELDEATPDEPALDESTPDELTLDDRLPPADPDPAESPHYVPPQTEHEMTINMLIDQDLIRLAKQQDVFTSKSLHSRLGEAAHVETIIMEGESVTNELDEALTARDSDALDTYAEAGRRSSDGNRKSGVTPGARRSGAKRSGDDDVLLHTAARRRDRMRAGRRRSGPAGYKVICGVVALTLVLAAQVVHAYRDSLATYPMFDRTVGSVYRLLGEPLNPDWNIKEWQFEATSGRTDELDEVLIISSRVANNSARSLPYPLLHVSLTDRWEEIIGSTVLDPADYLAGSANPSGRVPPGESFTAAVRVEAPSPDATGFKLNVCYREPGNRVRCATEDFKD
jgi:predicted Zn finger-like uncharacterized protein